MRVLSCLFGLLIINCLQFYKRSGCSYACSFINSAASRE